MFSIWYAAIDFVNFPINFLRSLEQLGYLGSEFGIAYKHCIALGFDRLILE